jgi:hypothetical protein
MTFSDPSSAGSRRLSVKHITRYGNNQTNRMIPVVRERSFFQERLGGYPCYQGERL